MGRIGATLSGIERSLLNRLAEADAQVTLSALRMSTGNRINSAADDPTAFTRLSEYQTRLSTVRATMTNVTAAGSMVTQTQSALDSVRTQLDTIRTELLKDETGSLNPAERAEAQANIDAAISEINTVATSSIDGRRLLDGSANFDVSGRNATQVRDVRVYATGGATLNIIGSVATAATQAQLVYSGDASNLITDDATFTLTGDVGTEQFSVTNGQTLSAVATEINSNSHKTGVTAAVDADAHTLTFTSVRYGSAAPATIAVGEGTFIVAAGETTTNAGDDVQATINGRGYAGGGNRITVTENGAHYDVEFAGGFSGDFDSITVSNEALSFAVATDLNRAATLALPSIQAEYLGGLSGHLNELASGGGLDGLAANTSQAIRVVDEALAQLTVTEGAVDGFYSASVASTSSYLSDLEEDLESAIDDINLVDDTEETQRQAYFLNLASNSIAGLAILREQRSGIVTLIQQLAGLT
ncbi:MAG: flagellin [Pirellulales bacterium]|nr:flagellin [Pirellulales bacterium]